MGTLRKPKRSSGSDLELMRLELETLPARLFTQLPVETRITVQAHGTQKEFVLTTASEAPARAGRSSVRGPCWLVASEVDALVLGVEAERTFAADLTAFALGKLRDRSFRVTEEHTLAGAQAPDPDLDDLRSLTLGELLEALELEITRIELGPADAQPGEEAAPAAHAA